MSIVKVVIVDQNVFDAALDCAWGKWQTGLLLGTEDWKGFGDYKTARFYPAASKWNRKYNNSKAAFLDRMNQKEIDYYWLYLDQGKACLCFGSKGPLNYKSAYLLQMNSINIKQADLCRFIKKTKCSFTDALLHHVSVLKIEGKLLNQYGYKPHTDRFAPYPMSKRWKGTDKGQSWDRERKKFLAEWKKQKEKAAKKAAQDDPSLYTF